MLIVFKLLHCGQPEYLRSLLTISKPLRALRSSANGLLLEVPFCKTETASCAFAVLAPKLWNALPIDLRALAEAVGELTASTHRFKSLLKTLLFKGAYCAAG